MVLPVNITADSNYIQLCGIAVMVFLQALGTQIVPCLLSHAASGRIHKSHLLGSSASFGAAAIYCSNSYFEFHSQWLEDLQRTLFIFLNSTACAARGGRCLWSLYNKLLVFLKGKTICIRRERKMDEPKLGTSPHWYCEKHRKNSGGGDTLAGRSHGTLCVCPPPHYYFWETSSFYFVLVGATLGILILSSQCLLFTPKGFLSLRRLFCSI